MHLMRNLAGAAVLCVAAIVAGCTVAVDEPPSRGDACTREYAPVCAARGDERRTYSNSCMARASGNRVIHDGECRGGGRDRDRDRGRERDRPRACTQQYDPVCARRGGERRTFSNSCMARASGADVVHEGECGRRGGRDRDRDRESRACTREYAPVCARRGRDTRTFPNSCEAQREDYRIVADGRC